MDNVDDKKCNAMNILIKYLKKRKKQVRLSIYFARMMMMSDFKKQKYKCELQEINRALFFLSSVSDKENKKKAIIELMQDAEKLGLYDYC
jgi:hypothetical protein